ncbi:hypothetical protein MLD38_020714 [Melastoma candidum]|uniref:Uncharacterized protein n=1 Tax=Melastoma candidum TaxID=119954 RepID=A0ACB9QHL4_9MYRT|nr:hypothetical protein MLD38_020714 [Melastoma candidum]
MNTLKTHRFVRPLSLPPPPVVYMSTSHPLPESVPCQPRDYPKPLSPPLPAASKQIELSRAMSATSRSDLLEISEGDVVYEDEWLLVVNKPQGVYCENILNSVRRLLTTGRLEDGRTDALLELHLANRLDRDTSGVLLITKSHKVAAKLVRAFTEHMVVKSYIALCVGVAPKWDRITIRSGHGRSKFGAWRVYATSDVGRALPGGSLVRNMETSFRVLSIREGSFIKVPSPRNTDDDQEIMVVEEESKSVLDGTEAKVEVLVRAFPKSGRTHQIRLHCQYLGIPLIGDVKYEGMHEWEGKAFEFHLLHAESLSFEHPITRLPIKIQAPIPSWASMPCGVERS